MKTSLGRHKLTLATLNYFCLNNKKKKFFFNLKSSEMSQLPLSGSFEYLCYGSTAILNILFCPVRNRLNLTSTDGPALKGLI